VELGQANDWTGRVLSDRYQLLSYSTRGRGWDEYHALDIDTNDRVLIKILSTSISEDAEFLRRLTLDIATASFIDHPHVQRVFDWGRSGEVVYLVTETFRGVSLQLLLDRGHQLTAAQATKLGFEIASGLNAVHQSGLCHGDISPSNLLIGTDGSSKLANFFLANAFSAAEAGRLSVVGTGLMEPSVKFAAPEALSGGGGPESDVYSLVASLVASISEETGESERTWRNLSNGERDQDLKIPVEFERAREILSEGGQFESTVRCHAISLTEGLIEATKGFTKPANIAIPKFLLVGFDGDSVASSVNRSSETLSPKWRPVRKLVATVALVFALLSAGTAWAVSSVQPQGLPAHLVQQYTGRTVGEVRAIADSRSWVLDEDQVRTDDLPAGIVLAQRPAPGRRLAEGEMLVVEVASGPRLRMTPLVLGLPTAAAVARLETKGFEVDLVQPLYDEKIAAGEVIKVLINGESALGGGLREPGTRAVLVVSGGPVPRTVPMLVGLDFSNAEQVLNELQLRVARPVGLEPSETVGEGTVLSQGLTPGRLVDRESEVSLTISSGPDLQEVPDMRGLTVFDAERRLAEVGLQVGEIRGDGLKVQGTEPAAGTFLRPGSPVLLWMPLQD
jgi:beta-lactam-binding protein with PASTA domain